MRYRGYRAILYRFLRYDHVDEDSRTEIHRGGRQDNSGRQKRREYVDLDGSQRRRDIVAEMLLLDLDSKTNEMEKEVRVIPEPELQILEEWGK